MSSGVHDVLPSSKVADYELPLRLLTDGPNMRIESISLVAGSC